MGLFDGKKTDGSGAPVAQPDAQPQPPVQDKSKETPPADEAAVSANAPTVAEAIELAITLALTHPSELDLLNERVAKLGELRGMLDPALALRFNRLVCTLGVAGVPTETQVEALASHLGLNLK